MDSNKMYVPDIQKWINFYQNSTKEIHNSYPEHKGGQTRQIGGSLTGGERSVVVPIEKRSNTTNEQGPVTLKLVSPSQQVVEQAKSELATVRKGIKRKTASKLISNSKKRRIVKTTRKHRQKRQRVTVKRLKTKKTKSKPKKKNKPRSVKKLSLKTKKRGSFNDILS
ncbi:unnamed protein product [Mytilus coruscus]|uniref:Uncharacterized protein n=1 Tax=Mytilus coruscus TaxID=42192 RepID=A0A6J8AJM6_MYTCO|nr:unnamed protein product [Mytilus coruscus]